MGNVENYGTDKYHHKPELSQTKVDCKRSKCPIYTAMIEKEEFSQENLDHLNNQIHFSSVSFAKCM